MAENDEILGISGHLDISDITNSITELYNELGKIENMSKDMSAKVERAFQDVANASEKTIAGSAKQALEVFSKAFEDAKNSADQNVLKIEETIGKLQTRLATLTEQRNDTIVGSNTYNQLTKEMEGLNAQIQSQQNYLTAAKDEVMRLGDEYSTFLTKVSSANATIETFNGLSTAATTATTGNALSHAGATGVIAAETTTRTKNTEAIIKEGEALADNSAALEAQQHQITSASNSVVEYDEKINSLRQKIDELNVQIADAGSENAEPFEKQKAAYEDEINLLEERKRQILEFGDVASEANRKAADSAETMSDEWKEYLSHIQDRLEATPVLLDRLKEKLENISKTPDNEGLVDSIRNDITALEELTQKGITTENQAQKLTEVFERLSDSEAKLDSSLTSGGSALDYYKEKLQVLEEELEQLKQKHEEALQVGEGLSIPSAIADKGAEYGLWGEERSQKIVEINEKIKQKKEEIAAAEKRLQTELDKTKQKTEGVSKAAGGETDKIKKLTSSLGDLKSGASALSGAATTSVSGFTGALSKLMSLGAKAGPWGAAIAAAIAIVVAEIYIAYKAIRALSEELQKFKEAMVPLKEYVDNNTFKQLSDDFVHLSMTSTHSAEDMAGAAMKWVKMFENIRNSPKAIEDLVLASEKLASITGKTTTEVSKNLTKIAGAFHLNAFEAKMSVNALVNAAHDSAYSIDEITSALVSSGTRAKQAHVSFDEMTSALAAVSRNYTSASQAASNYVRIMQRLESQTNERYKPSVVGANQALKNLNQDMKEGQNVSKMFGKLLYNQAKYFIENADAIDKNAESLYDGTEKAKRLNEEEEKLETHKKRLANAYSALKKSFDVNVTPVFIDFIEILVTAITKVEGFAKSFGEMVDYVAGEDSVLGKIFRSGAFQYIVGAAGGLGGIAGVYSFRSLSEDTEKRRQQESNESKVREYFDTTLMNLRAQDPKKEITELIKEAAETTEKEFTSITTALKSGHFTLGRSVDIKRIIKEQSDNALSEIVNSENPFIDDDQTDSKKEVKEEEAKAKLLYQQRKERSRLLRDLEMAEEEAIIATMKDGAEKEARLQKFNHQKRLNQIDDEQQALLDKNIQYAEQLYNASKKETDRGFYAKGLYKKVGLDYEQNDLVKAKRRKEIADDKKEREEIVKAQQQQLYDYLKEYGSFQQQREAIAKEYDQKIADTTDDIQKASLEKQKKEAIDALNFEELQQSIDWEFVFGNLNQYSVSALRDLKKKLRNALDAKEVTVENAKILTEKINEIEENTLSRSDVWANILPGLRERKRLVEQTANAEALYQKSLKEEATAIDKVIADKKAIKVALEKENIKEFTNSLGQKITVELETISEENKEKLLASLDKDSDVYKALLTLFNNLAVDAAGAGTAHQSTAQSRNHYKELSKSLDKGDFKKLASDLFNTEGMGFSEISGLINQNAQSMSEFVDKIGAEDTDFGKAVHGFADSCNGFNNAIQSLAKGDIFGAINGIIDGFMGFKTIGQALGIFGGADNHAEEMEVQAEANAALTVISDHVAHIREDLEKAYGANAVKIYEDLKDYLESATKQYNTNVQSAGNDNYGGGNSEWYHRNKNGGEGANGYVSRIKAEYGLNFEGTSWQDLFRYLASLQNGEGARILNDILYKNKNMTDVAAELLRTNSYDQGAIAKYVREWADSWEDWEASSEELKERLTTTTADSLFEDFMNSLYDIADGAENVEEKMADDWQRMINRMVLNNIIGEKYKQQIAQLYDDWSKELAELEKQRESLSPEEYQRRLNEINNRYRNNYERIRDNAINEVNNAKDAGFVQETSENKKQLSPSYNSANNITYEQADQLAGIGINMSLILEQGLIEVKEQTLLQTAMSQNLISIDSKVGSIDTNVALMKETQETMNDHLANIEANTNVLPDMRDDLQKIRKKLNEE